MGIQTLQKHYAIFWGQDIPCDIVTSDADLTKYDLVIAPMLYMQRPATMAALQAYVAQGGTLVSSYFSGMVDEFDRVLLGGFPSPLRELFGIETRELDTLLPGEHYHVQYEDQVYQTHDYDEVLRATTATVLAHYTDNFYQETPAVTAHAYQKGTAYYIGARLDREFLSAFYQKIIAKLHLANQFVTASSYQVSCQTRYQNGNQYHFLMNFSEDVQNVAIQRPATDLLTGQHVDQQLTLPKYGVMVLREPL